MDKRATITAVTRKNDAAGKLQTNLTPVTTLSGKDLVERWAAYTRCGHGTNYRVVRISRKIRAVG